MLGYENASEPLGTLAQWKAETVHNDVSMTHTTLPSYTCSQTASSRASTFCTDCADEPADHADEPPSAGYGCLQLEGLIEAMGKQELRGLEFPFLMADPSRLGCPLVVCSDGFSCLTGYGAGETLGRESTSQLHGREAAEFLRYASCSELYLGGSTCAGEVSITLGELVTLQTRATRCGARFSCMTYLKQVELDDEMFVIAVQACPEEHGSAETPAERLEGTFTQLRKNMQVAVQVLAREFWFSAPMQRQVAEARGTATALHHLATKRDA